MPSNKTTEFANTPRTAEAVSRLATMRKGQRHTKRGVLPGDGIEFVWRLLSGAEKQAALAAAVQRMEALKLPIELRSYSDLEDECVWQLLAQAMRDPQHPGPSGTYPETLARDADELRELLTVDERDALITAYLDFEDEVDPDPATISDELYAAIETAVKKRDARALRNFGSNLLASFVLSGASPRAN